VIFRARRFEQRLRVVLPEERSAAIKQVGILVAKRLPASGCSTLSPVRDLNQEKPAYGLVVFAVLSDAFGKPAQGSSESLDGFG
jgi:hypothetical protein